MLIIGNARIEPPVVLGPMAGVTDQPFRLLVKEMGCGLVCSEMISDKALTYRNVRTLAMLRIDPRERPVSVQLFGADPDTMGKAARILAEFQPEIIDINMGCPVPKVVGNGEGAALLRDLDRAARIIAAVVENASCPVTVKMRTGWAAGEMVAPELAVAAEKQGAAAVIVHARTRDQFYAGRADWSVIRKVKERVAIPVIGNGDVDSPAAAERLLKETGCDGVMVARAALGRPWLLRQISRYLQTGECLPDPPVSERFRIMRTHLAAQLNWSGEERGVREMRKHLGWYFKGLPDAARMRERVNRIEKAGELFRLLAEYEAKLSSNL